MGIHPFVFDSIVGIEPQKATNHRDDTSTYDTKREKQEKSSTNNTNRTPGKTAQAPAAAFGDYMYTHKMKRRKPNASKHLLLFVGVF